jgi:23S rRNA (guanosine2251-2'-O)-methyltransferase
MDRIRKLSHSEISENRLDPHSVIDTHRMPVYGLLDNIRSMYNVGSMFRTSDGAFLQKIFLTGYTATPEKNEVRKTALGAADTIPWEYSRDPIPILQHLKSLNVSIIVLEHTTKSIPYYEVQPDVFPACIVVGNELTGVSDSILEYADLAIEIPMFGIKQSLNVAVAYGIVLFDMVRLYRGK